MKLHRLVLMAALSLSLLGCDRDRSEGIKLVNAGIAAANAGASEVAYANFMRATRIDPDNHRAYYEAALIDLYDKADGRERGLTLLETAEKLEPRDRDVLFQLGRTLVLGGEVDRGLRYLDRTIEADPNYAPAWYYRAVGQVATGRFEEADRAFREAIAIDPMYAPAYRDLGDLYEQFDATDAARAIYLEGVRHVGDDPDLLNPLGLLAMDSGQAQEAVELFDRAVARGGLRQDSIFNLAFAYVEVGNARAAYRRLGEYVNNADPTEAENIRVAMLLRSAMQEEIERARAAAEAEAEGGGEPPAPAP